MWLRKILYSSEDIYQTTDIAIVSFHFLIVKKVNAKSTKLTLH
jgi:hypothetical protein